MTSEHEDPQARIAALEHEVAELRAKLGPAPEKVPGDEHLSAAVLPSRTRATVLAVLIGIAALVGILLLTYGLSRIIGPFSRHAAEAISPVVTPSRGPGSAPSPSLKGRPNQGTQRPAPRAPGL